MNDLTVSVVVVSRGRPAALRRCLLGISQLQFDPFEVVVVADPAGISAAEDLDFSEHLKLLPFDEANISAARNLGITHAAGDVVAFIDDDAVPEPHWLTYLVAPAKQSDVAAMGGFVRGRNGISFQWRARSLDAFGEAHDLDVDPTQASILTPPNDQAIKTEGTNMAVRRDVLVRLGGFDPAFHYFLDETDLNMRMARAGYATAIVPLAEVHHGFEANATRSSARVPRDLFDIGASWAVFQRKHVPKAERQQKWAHLRQEQRLRLLRHMVEGGLEPRDMRRLMGRLNDGYAEGIARKLGNPQLASHPASPFTPFSRQPRQSVLKLTRPFRLKKDLRDAAAKVKKGNIVTLLCLSRSAMFHKVRFLENGVWLQNGGIYGRSDRKDRFFRVTTRSRRAQSERFRVANQRGLKEK